MQFHIVGAMSRDGLQFNTELYGSGGSKTEIKLLPEHRDCSEARI